MDQQQLLIALYELKRQTFLIGYIQNPDRFDSALAYAYYKRVAPIFHENIARETYDSDPFKEVYAVKASFVEEVIKYVDEKARAKDLKAIEFNKLEDHFGGYKTNRMELVHLLEYTRITGRFDEEVWNAIENRAPVEANPIEAKFSPNDVEFH